jgi:YVTN family beta-propeller protein
MKRALFQLVAVIVLFGLTTTDQCKAADYAYIADMANVTVSAFRLSDRKVTATIDLSGAGNAPKSVAISPDDMRVYVAHQDNGKVAIIDATDNTLLDEVTVGGEPIGISVSPDGRHVYVTDNQMNRLCILDTTTDDYWINSISLDVDPVGVAVSPDGAFVYVVGKKTNSEDGKDNGFLLAFSSSQIGDDFTDDAEPRQVLLGIAKPFGVAVSPSNDYIYVANRNGDPDDDSELGTVSVIERSDIHALVELAESIVVGNNPRGIAVSPDLSSGQGSSYYLCVANRLDDTIFVYNVTETDAAVPNIEFDRDVIVGTRPFGISMTASPDGSLVTAYVTNIGNNKTDGSITILQLPEYDISSVSFDVEGDSFEPTSFGQFIANFPDPAEPQDFIAQAISGSEIELRWTCDASLIPIITEFNIERSADENGPWDLLTTIDAEVDAFTYTDTGRTEGTVYYYRIQAVNAVGNSEYTTTQAKTFPAAPTDLTATAISPYQIDLSWSHDGNGVAEFIIFRKPGPNKTDDFEEIDRVLKNVRNYSDTIKLSDFTSYTYRIYAARETEDDLSAFDDSVIIAYSNEESATTFLAAPSGLSANAYYRKHIDLAWQDNSGAEAGFKIERKKISEDKDIDASSDGDGATSSQDTYSIIAQVGANVSAFRDTDVESGETYSYRVLAFSGSEESEYSHEVQEDTSSSTCFITTASSAIFGSHVGNPVVGAPLVFLLFLLSGVTCIFAEQRKSTQP